MTDRPNMKPCPFCGGAEIETSLVQGGPFAPRNACSDCGATGPVEHHDTIGSKADAWNTRARGSGKSQPVVETAEHLQAARASLGLTQAALATVLRASGGRIVRKWEGGKQPVPGPVGVAMEALLSGWRPKS